MVELLSDIEVCLFVTDIPAAPRATLTCSGLSNKPASSRSTSGRGIIDRVGVVDSALPIVPPHPAIRTQMTAAASVAVGWRMCSSPLQPCPTDQRGAILPMPRHVKKMVRQVRRRLQEVERRFLITKTTVLDNDWAPERSYNGCLPAPARRDAKRSTGWFV